ncbi:MAG: esterase-like activity of phytase family protein, partial [Cyanobacteria bacterium P01_D01_bin.2]
MLNWILRRGRDGLWIVCLAIGLLGITGCAVPQVSAEERLFLDLSVTAIDHVVLPMAEFEGTQVGGLSALAYDRDRDRYYALADDRQQPRFYTLTLDFDSTAINGVTIDAVTPLTDGDGGSIAPLDAEGMVLTPS